MNIQERELLNDQLEHALENNMGTLAENLILQGADVHFTSQIPIMKLVYSNSTELVKLLLKHGATTDIDNDNVLRNFLDPHQTEMCKILIEDSNIDISHGHLIYYAAIANNPDILQFLIDKCTNSHLDYNYTLKQVVDQQKSEAVKVLVKNGVDFHLNNNISTAAFRGQISMIESFVEYGLNLDLYHEEILINGKRHLSIIKYLHNNGYNCNKIIKEAAGGGHLDIVQFLIIEGKSDINELLKYDSIDEDVLPWVIQYKKSSDLSMILNTQLAKKDISTHSNRSKLKV